MAQEHSIGKLTKSGQGTVVFPGTLDKAVLFNETCGKSITNLGVWREFDMDTMFPLPGDSEYDLGTATREFWKKHLPTFKTVTAEGGRLVFSNTPEDLKKGYNNFLDMAGMKIKFASGKDTYVYQFLKKRGELKGGDVKEISRMFKSEDSWFLVGGSKIIGDLDKKLNGIVDKMRQEAAGVVSEDRRFYVSGWIRNTGSPKDLSPIPEISYGDRTFLSDIWAHYLFDITSQGEEWGNRPVGKLKKNNLLRFEDDSYAPTVRVPQEWIDYTEKLKTKKIYRLSEKVPYPQLTYNDIPKVDENSVYCDVGEFNVAKYLSEYDHSSPMDLYWLEEEEGESTLTEILEKEFEAIYTGRPFDLCIDNPNSLLKNKKKRKYKTYKYVEYWKVTKPWETAETKYTIGLVNTKELYVLDNVEGESGMVWSGIFLSPGVWDGIDYSQFKVPVTAQSPSPVLEDGCCIFNPRTDLPIFGMNEDFVIPDIIERDGEYILNIERDVYTPPPGYESNGRNNIFIKAKIPGEWRNRIDTSQIGIYWGSGKNTLSESNKSRLPQVFKQATGLMRSAYLVTQEIASGTKAIGEKYELDSPGKVTIDSYDSWTRYGGFRILKGLGDYLDSYNRVKRPVGRIPEFDRFGYSFLGNDLVRTLDTPDGDILPSFGVNCLTFSPSFRVDHQEYRDGYYDFCHLARMVMKVEYFGAGEKPFTGEYLEYKKLLDKLMSTQRVFDKKWMLWGRKLDFSNHYETYRGYGGFFFLDKKTRDYITSKDWTYDNNGQNSNTIDIILSHLNNSNRFESLYTKFDTFTENIKNTDVTNLTYVSIPHLSGGNPEFVLFGGDYINNDESIFNQRYKISDRVFRYRNPGIPHTYGITVSRDDSDLADGHSRRNRRRYPHYPKPTRPNEYSTSNISVRTFDYNGIVEGIVIGGYSSNYSYSEAYKYKTKHIAYVTRKGEDIWSYCGNIRQHRNNTLSDRTMGSSYLDNYYPYDQVGSFRSVPFGSVIPGNSFFNNKTGQTLSTTPIEPCMFSQMAASYAAEKNIRPGDKFSFYCAGEYNKLWYDNVGGKNLLNESDGLFCKISVMCRRIPFASTSKLALAKGKRISDRNSIESVKREFILGELVFKCTNARTLNHIHSDLYRSGFGIRVGTSEYEDYEKEASKRTQKLGLEGVSLSPESNQQRLLDRHLLISPRFKFLRPGRTSDSSICPDNIEQMMEVVFKYNVTGGLRLTSDTGLSYDRGSFYEVEQNGDEYSIKNYVQPKDEKILDDVQPMYLDYIKNTYRYVGKSILGTEIGSGGNVSYRSAWSPLPGVNNFSAPTSSSGDCHSCYVRSSGLSSYNIVVSQGRVNFPCASGRDDSYNPRNTEIYTKQDLGNSKTVLMMTSMKVTL